MKTTKEISVIFNEKAVKKIKSMKITYNSASWKCDLLKAINDKAEEYDLIHCFNHISDPEEREKEISALCYALALHKLPYIKESILIEYKHMMPFEIEKVAPTLKVKLN